MHKTAELQDFLHLWSARPQGSSALHFITLEGATLRMHSNHPPPSPLPFFLPPFSTPPPFSPSLLGPGVCFSKDSVYTELSP